MKIKWTDDRHVPAATQRIHILIQGDVSIC